MIGDNPHNYHNVQHFLRLVQYLAYFLPDITAYPLPLSLCTHNGKLFIWTPLLDKGFEFIKTLMCMQGSCFNAHQTPRTRE